MKRRNLWVLVVKYQKRSDKGTLLWKTKFDQSTSAIKDQVLIVYKIEYNNTI